MTQVCLFVEKFYQKNRIFDLEDSTANRDNCLYPYWLLKEELKKENILLETPDLCLNNKNLPLTIFNDLPKNLEEITSLNSSFKYGLLFETELIKPQNWDLSFHKALNKVFTWNDDWVDNKKYFKFNFPQPPLSKKKAEQNYHRPIFCSLIAGNKHSSHPLELYSERRKAIDFFSKGHHQKKGPFHLYGMDWGLLQLPHIPSLFNKILKKAKIPTFFPFDYPSYKGPVVSKYETLSQSVFCLCYENAKNISGYITEKIFDCFFAGCIPIYWGPDNIDQHIPKDLFIDRRQFKSLEELLEFLLSLSEVEIINIREKISSFLESPKYYPFTSSFFVEVLSKHIRMDLELYKIRS